jgi:GTP cyclohydrolase IA
MVEGKWHPVITTTPAMMAEMAEMAVETLLRFMGQDLNREGLKETPARVVRALKEMTSGYQTDVTTLFKTFTNNCDEMVVVGNIAFTSLCEHHLLPFHGYVHVGYLPDGKVIGVSKIPRIVEAFARRLQLQERMTTDIANALTGGLRPRGCGVVAKATHNCVSCRGVRQADVTVTTSCLTGVFREDQKTRQEFLRLAKR